MFRSLLLSLTAPSAPPSGPPFSSDSLYQTGAKIAFVGISAVLLNLLILMIVVSLSERIIERLSRSGKNPEESHD